MITEQDLVLPRTLYAMSGNSANVWQTHIYYANAIAGLGADHIVNVVSGWGRQYERFWRLEAGNEDSAHYRMKEGRFPLKLQVLNRKWQLQAQKEMLVELVCPQAEADCAVLCIGDSLTRGGDYVAHMQARLSGVRSVGIRTYDDGQVNREGRGGWTLLNYFTAGRRSGGDSPFLFPAGVSGSRYWGNTEFWKHVVHLAPTGYDYEGFQKIARGWAADGSPFVYDLTGYPAAPRAGDVVFDPLAADGGAFMQFASDGWRPMETQPEWEFSFAKYMERYADAYRFRGEVKAPNIVTVLLGANDFQKTDGIEPGVGEYLAGIERLIASVREYDPAIRVIVNMPVGGAGQDAWGMQLGCMGNAYRYLLNMQETGRRILAQWDNEERQRQGVYVCPMLLVLDPQHGFDFRQEPVNQYVPELAARHSNWVHPNKAGHQQMGDALAAVVQKIRNDAGRTGW